MDYFSEDIFNDAKMTKHDMMEMTYKPFYLYWRQQLFERVMRLFVWENTGDVKPKEIEQRLILSGTCGITKYNGQLTAFFGSFYGPTVYQDEFTNYIVHSPVFSKDFKVDKDITVIDNSALRNPVFPLIHHYAILLAQNEVSLCDAMVNIRDINGIPVAQNENQRASILNYKGKLFEGKYDVVMDPAFLGVEYKGTSSSANSQIIVDLIQAKKDILSNFYSDIGIRSAFVKKSNTVESEVEADTTLLLLNLSDMLDSRQKGAEKVNDMFGTNWSVKIADEINYGLENDPEKRGGNDNEKRDDSETV